MLPTDVGRPIGEIRPSLTTLNSLDPLIATVIEEVRPFEREVQDNEGTWWLLRIFPYRTQDNLIDGAVVALIDVDALKRAEGGLREALDYSSAIVETTHEPLLVLDSEERVVRANRAFREKFHLDLAAIEGRSIGEIEGRRWNIPALRDLLQRVITERRNIEDCSIENEFEGLGRRSLMFNARLIDQVEAEPLVLLAIEDITERKQRLESLAAAVRARDDFLAMLSHELRSPLAAIDAAARVLRPSIDQSPSARNSIEALERQLGQLRRLVEDLLDVSRLAHGKITLRTEPLELTSAVEQAIDAARALAEARAHEIAVRLPKEEVWIEADRVRLDQILQNLLSNAIKFSDAGGRVVVSVDVNATGEAVLKVADNGSGIPRELLGRVFDAFTQGDNVKDGRAGLGLGLSLVKRLVELHDGTVEAISDKVRPGTEIVVQLPAIEAPSQRETAAVDRDAPTRSSVGRRILIVEDNADAASTMATLLEMMGHQVQVVHDGASALAAFADGQRPEVAIVDVGLPDMSGYDLARAIRTQPAASRVTLIAHTGYGQDADRELAREAGFDHHMVKPIDWKALERVLEDGEGEREGGGEVDETL
jgi:two-component system CheB/CheR fusion protein